MLNEQIRAEEMNAEHIRSRIASLNQSFRKKKGTEAAIRKKSSSLRSRWRPWRSGSVREKTSWSRLLPVYPALKDPLRTEKRQLIGALNERSGLSVKKQRYDTLLEQVQVRRSEVAQKLLKVKTDEEAWDGQIQEQEKALASVNQAIETLVTEGEILEGEAREAAGQIARLNKNLNNAQRNTTPPIPAWNP